MDSAITVSLKAIQTIAVLIASIHSTPSVITQIKNKTEQLSITLKTLHRQSQTHILVQTEIDGFLANQKICNRILERIEEVIGDYVHGSKARYRLFKAVTFEFGAKGELESLIGDLDTSVKYFSRDFRM